MPRTSPSSQTASSAHRTGFMCESCYIPFTNQAHLRRHVQAKHNSNPTKYHCPVQGCTHETQQQSNLKAHLALKHSATRPHFCYVCSKGFKLIPHLRKHEQSRSHLVKCAQFMPNRQFSINLHSPTSATSADTVDNFLLNPGDSVDLYNPTISTDTVESLLANPGDSTRSYSDSPSPYSDAPSPASLMWPIDIEALIANLPHPEMFTPAYYDPPSSRDAQHENRTSSRRESRRTSPY
ncbi:hypothetical protein BOTBODRAFT_496535 [Botryobasidium botryosum FD-172 SS1]|uniref:C2H2-type domain-containing protein n=1 Tax=Botryobasidium botryosum (strain FD-172 SS1) TaxID=930990 RepID=A0A067M3V0_BOTB1|nr:hypothetical protein BOTBODRAFT_496535 [Botryobasidium botryosum FD-172 SS1]